MRKIFLLALSLAALAGALSVPPAEAVGGGGGACPICTTYPDGSQCCVSCWCDASGRIIACTDHYCPPAGGLD
ncbi:MAG TPA: hypothetical protein VKK31_05495 [Thermoanaerobaculia bacterium]|nr:hypothetical protein [Thermoanaerobaculia bacterium]